MAAVVASICFVSSSKSSGSFESAARRILRGASLNVMINLASVKDPAQVKALSEDLDRALDGAEAQRKRITDFVETRIAR